jgi:hypothetical protein
LIDWLLQKNTMGENGMMKSKNLLMAMIIGLMLCAIMAMSQAVSLAKNSNNSGAVTIARDLSGTYKSSGTRPDGNKFGGGSVKVEKAGNLYKLTWTHPGEPAYQGIGIPSQDGYGLAVGWGKDGNYGVVVYTINGGKLSGEWASPTQTGVGTEVLEGPASLNGSYKIIKSTGNYTGKVSITPTGDTYAVSWTLDSGERYSGVGIRFDETLFVGYGTGKKEYGVAAYLVTEDALDGVWTFLTSNRVGKERLAR